MILTSYGMIPTSQAINPWRLIAYGGSDPNGGIYMSSVNGDKFFELSNSTVSGFDENSGAAYSIPLDTLVYSGYLTYTSTNDGNTYTQIDPSPTNTSQPIIWADGLGLFVGGRISATPSYSYDGFNWTIPDGIIFPRPLGGLYWDSTSLAIRGVGTDFTTESYDGINWSIYSLSISNPGFWTSITYGNGVYVAVGNKGTNNVMYSSNFYNWDSLTIGGGITRLQQVTFSPTLNLFCAVGGISTLGLTTGVIYTSADGINWTLVYDEANTYYTDVIWSTGFNAFYVVDAFGTDLKYRILKSTDTDGWFKKGPLTSTKYGTIVELIA